MTVHKQIKRKPQENTESSSQDMIERNGWVEINHNELVEDLDEPENGRSVLIVWIKDSDMII